MWNLIFAIFQGEIQLIKIAAIPDTAYDLCTEYVSDCNVTWNNNLNTIPERVDVENGNKPSEIETNTNGVSTEIYDGVDFNVGIFVVFFQKIIYRYN